MSFEYQQQSPSSSEGNGEVVPVSPEQARKRFDENTFAATLVDATNAIPAFNEDVETPVKFAARIVVALDKVLRPLVVPAVLDNNVVKTGAIPCVASSGKEYVLSLTDLAREIAGAVEASWRVENQGQLASEGMNYDIGGPLGEAVRRLIDSLATK